MISPFSEVGAKVNLGNQYIISVEYVLVPLRKGSNHNEKRKYSN